MRQVLISFMVLLLAGCGSAQMPAPAPVGSPPAAADPRPNVYPVEKASPPAVTTEAISGPRPVMAAPPPATALLWTQRTNLIAAEVIRTSVALTDEPYNLILFPKAPVTGNERAQYTYLCETWRASFPTKSQLYSLTKNDSSVLVVPMYWMLVDDGKADILDKKSCKEFVRDYDYARAQVFAVKNNLSLTKVQLICKLKDGLITMNLTKVIKKKDIVLAFGVWRTKMCHFPKRGTTLYTYDIYSSAKEIMGALGTLLAMK